MTDVDRLALADLIYKSVEPILAEITEPSREDYLPAVDAIVARLSASPAPGYAVKPLEWHKSHMTPWQDDWHTIAPFIYTVRCADENGWKWSFGGGHGYERTPEAAKATAHADYEQRIRSAIAAGEEVTGWQPIETAPTNGTEHAWPYVTVLVADENGDVTQADFKGEDGWWPANLDSEYGSQIYPTHWQPLPAPPTITAKEAPKP